MAGKTWLVTGASSGIGLEMCKQLAARGELVYGTCRKPNDKMKEVGMKGIIEGIDVTADDVGAKLVAALKDVKIDVLVNNAGGFTAKENKSGGMEAFGQQSLASVKMDEMRYNFEVNSLGPLKVSQALIDQISAPGGKIAIVSSLVGSIADAGGGMYAYRASKTAVNMIGKAMSCDLKDKGVSVGLIHPGLIATSFAGDDNNIPEPMKKMQRSVEEGSKGVIEAIDGMTIENTGSFWHGNYGDGVKTCPW